MNRAPWIWPPGGTPWNWPPVVAVPPLTQQPPLPASAVEYWHSELSNEFLDTVTFAERWIGQLRGVEFKLHWLLAGAEKTSPDLPYFNGRAVLKCRDQQRQSYVTQPIEGILPPLTQPGTYPWIYMIGRYRELPIPISGTGACMIGLAKGDDHANYFGNIIYPKPATTPDVFFQNSAGSIVNGAGTNLTPHRYKLWRDGTRLHFQVDNTDQSVSAIGPTAAQIDRVCLGMNMGAYNDPASTSIAFILICSAKPTINEEALLDNWARAYWGVP